MTDNEIFGLLSAPIRHFIYNKGWTSFRPIQRAAIQRIMSTDKNYILASRTASGKTEAAFLPVLSKTDFNSKGVKVLYISPLIALINDQMSRVEELCRYLDVKVTKWHGEAKVSAKKRLLAHPEGIVLITPESLEAMFVNHPENAELLFAQLQYVIIDEIHYFIGTDRGVQLQSILTRLSRLHNDSSRSFITIGLSATIGDFTLAKRFTGDESNTSVLLDSARKPIDAQFCYFDDSDSRELPLELIKKIYRNTRADKALVFPNSRSRVEEIASKLKIIAERLGEHSNYFAHHASVDSEVREYVEFFAKNSEETPFAICCTSTLELGIDIGSVDLIIQVNATFSVSSLVQRAGRSGRRDGQHARLLVCSSEPMALLRALACWNLHERGEIEPQAQVEKPYDVLLHQMLSIIRQKTEIAPTELINILTTTPVFSEIKGEDVKLIIDSLLDADNQILELVGGKLVIGVDGERIVNRMDFYSVFTSERNMQVMFNGKRIGELQPNLNIKQGGNVILAAQLWTIESVDYEHYKVIVRPATDGKPPRFTSTLADISPLVEQEMLALLRSNEVSPLLDEKSAQVLGEMRSEFAAMGDGPIPMSEDNGKTHLHTFLGTRANRAIALLLSVALGAEVSYDDNVVEIPVPCMLVSPLLKKASLIDEDEIRQFINEQLDDNQGLIRTYTKYGHLLPMSMQVDVMLQKAYDIAAARRTLALI